MIDLLHSLIKIPDPPHINMKGFINLEGLPKQVYSCLSEIRQNNIIEIKQSIKNLSKCLSSYSQKLGPRAFANTLDIIKRIKIQINQKIIDSQQTTAIMILTYIQAEFTGLIDYSNGFNDSQFNMILSILNIFALIHISSNYFRQADNKDKWASSAHQKSIIFHQQIMSTSKQLISEEVKYQLALLSSLLKGVTLYLMQQYKQAKNILLQTLNQFSCGSTHHNPEPRLFQLQQITVCCLLYLEKTSRKLEKYDISHYYFTKAIQMLEKLEDGDRIKEYLRQEAIQTTRKVKLERVEKKLERKIGRSKEVTIKIKKCPSTLNACNQNEKKARVELQNIMMLQNQKTTFYKFRKQNICFLMTQQKKMKAKLANNNQLLSQFQAKEDQLLCNHQIKGLKAEIQALTQQTQAELEQYQEIKYANLGSLKPVAKINSYCSGLVQRLRYKRNLTIYQFLYGKVLSKTLCFFLMKMMKKKLSKQKKVIGYSKVQYGNLLHFSEIYEQFPPAIYNTAEKLPGFYFKIYPIQSTPSDNKFKYISLEDEIEINFEQAHLLKAEPFYNYLCVVPIDQQKYKLVRWKQYMNTKSFMTFNFINIFIRKLKLNLQKKKNYVKHSKRQIKVRFSNYDKYLTHTFLLAVSKLQQEPVQFASEYSYIEQPHQYKIDLYTISQDKYHNKAYNIRINKSWVSINPNVEDNQITQIYLDALYRNFGKNLLKIATIQKVCRMAFSKRILNKLKNNHGCALHIIVHKNIVYTYRKFKSLKGHLIIQNIQTKEIEVKESEIDVESFKLIDVIRKKLSGESCCKKKMRMILNFIKIKGFIKKIRHNIKKINQKSEFQRSFENRIIFTRLFDCYIYRNKKISQKIMFTLVVKSLIDFPRPYKFRIFTIEKCSQPIDIEMIIFNEQQKLLTNSLSKLNLVTNVICKTKAILPLNQQNSTDISSILKMNSRFSIGSFHSIMTLKGYETEKEFDQTTIRKFDGNNESNNHISALIEDEQKQNNECVIIKKNRKKSFGSRYNIKRTSIDLRTRMMNNPMRELNGDL